MLTNKNIEDNNPREEDIVINNKLRQFYSQYFHLVKSYILNNSGDLDDAKDVFQEVALIYFKIMPQVNTNAIDNVKNYLLGSARNIWLKKLKERRKVTSQGDLLNNVGESLETSLEQSIIDEKLNLVLKKIEEISEECKKIIQSAFYLKLSTIEIAEIMDYSESFVKLKKFRCLQALRKLVFNSPDYKSVLN